LRVRAAVAARALVAKPAFQAALLGVGAAAAQLRGVRLAALPAPGRLYELGEWGDLQARALRVLQGHACAWAVRRPVHGGPNAVHVKQTRSVCTRADWPLPTERWGCWVPVLVMHGKCMHGRRRVKRRDC